MATIDSILSQKDQNYEIIVVDDGSTDNSVKVVESITNNHIRLFQKENSGPSAARNFGVTMARGEWVLFLDADDTLEKDAISYLHELISIHKECHFFCCNHYIEDENGRRLYSNKYKEGFVRYPFMEWCRGLLMPRAGAALFQRELLVEYPFDESLRRYEDAENLFSIMRVVRVYRSSVPIMTYYRSTATASMPCRDINDDFIGHLSLNGKSFWEQYALYQLYLEGCNIYPKDMNDLYGPRFDKIKFKMATRFLKYIKCKENHNNIRKVKSSVKHCVKKSFRKIIQFSYPEISILQKNYSWDYINDGRSEVQVGKHVLIYSPSHICQTIIEDYTYIAMNSYISMTTIGKFCSIGPNLVCGWGIHPINGISTSPMFYSTMKQNGITLSEVDKIDERKPIRIGNDVFIGANVTILDGVSIGDGAVIGAGAVVSKDIPPYAVAVGCPIKIIRYRFEENQIRALRRIEWWNYDEERLKNVEKYFYDVEEFIEQEQNGE